MARAKNTPEDLARRNRGFELFCTIDAKGQRPTIREIAMTLGVTTAAVRYWMKSDSWQERINAVDDSIAKDVKEASQAFKTLLRGGLLRGLERMKMIVLDPKAMAKDQIDATEAFARIAKQFNAVDMDAAPLPNARMGAFHDDLPGEKKEEVDPWAGESMTSSVSSETLEPPPTLEPLLQPTLLQAPLTLELLAESTPLSPAD